MIRLMVQGDRDAKGIEEAVRALGELCKEREIGLNVGEAGKIVRILAETGAHVRVHQAKPEPPNVPEGFNGDIVDCVRYSLDINLPYGGVIPTQKRLAWAIRLAWLDTSDGFIFFPGREGTLAHLVPIMAFIAKGERDNGVARPRRVALVGWSEMKTDTILNLFEIGDEDDWIATFNSEEVARAITWLTDGLPAQ